MNHKNKKRPREQGQAAAQQPRSFKKDCWVLAIVFLAVLASYSNSIRGTFHFDDRHSIQENVFIRSLDPGPVWAEKNPFRFMGYYSFAVNYRLSGLDDVRGWHWFNIALHGLCAAAFYCLLRRMTALAGRPGSRLPLMASLLFAVHPLASEPVNYIQARHVQFYALFTLTGALCALLFLQAATRKQKALSVLGMAASILSGGLSKEVGIFFVPAAIGLCFLAFGRGRLRGWGWKKAGAALLAAAAAFVLVTHQVRPLGSLFGTSRHAVIGDRTFVTNLLTQAGIFFRYVSLAVPIASRLNADHHVVVVAPRTAGGWISAAMPLAALAALMWLA
jgi:hypothetical protein